VLHKSVVYLALSLGLLSILSSGCGSTFDPVSGGFPSQSPVRRSGSLTVDPALLTLPTGGFHYDPLLTVRNADGQVMWVDLPAEVRAVSSNPQVATVNERVRIRTTGKAGSAEINIHLVADPSVQATLRLTTVDATIQQVRVEGSTTFDVYVGQGVPLEVTAVLSSGDVVPHAQYSSDLDVVTGSEFAAVVDGVGLSALKPSPPNTPIAIGFFRGGGTAAGTISVRPMQLVSAQMQLAGNDSPSHDFTVPDGYNSLLELLGTFEDGTSRRLKLDQDYFLTLSGDPGFTFADPGYLSQPLEGKTANLQINLRDDIDGSLGRPDGVDIAARATTVDGDLVTNLSADFENYPEDQRLLSTYARELRVLADFPGLPHYRVSGFDALSLSAPFAAQGISTTGWPTLKATTSSGGGDVQLGLDGITTQLGSVSVVTPQVLAVGVLGKRLAGRISIELGQHLSFRTLVDYGDGVLLSRTADYPVVEALAHAAAQNPFWDLFNNATTYFLNVPSDSVAPDGFEFQPRDAEDHSLPATIKVDVVRQSDPD